MPLCSIEFIFYTTQIFICVALQSRQSQKNNKQITNLFPPYPSNASNSSHNLQMHYRTPLHSLSLWRAHAVSRLYAHTLGDFYASLSIKKFHTSLQNVLIKPLKFNRSIHLMYIYVKHTDVKPARTIFNCSL